MEREVSDEIKLVYEMFIKAHLLGFENGLRNALGREKPDESREALHRIWDGMQQAICDLAYRQYARGLATGLIDAGRHDLLARHPDIEKAAAVIMAEDLTREDHNDA